MTNVPFLDPGLRSLHTSLESFGGRNVPEGEAALAELLARLPDRQTIPDVRDGTSTTRGDVQRTSRRTLRRVLAIAAALVVFGGSAFAAVGGVGGHAFDRLFGGHPVPAAPVPAPVPAISDLQERLARGHGGIRAAATAPSDGDDHQSGSGPKGAAHHDTKGPADDQQDDPGDEPSDDEQGSGGEDQQGQDEGGSGEDQQSSDDQGEDGDDQGSGDQGSGDQGSGDQGGGGEGSGDQGSGGEGGNIAARSLR